jgi:predicted nucleic acid-binding Zn ribbon protein
MSYGQEKKILCTLEASLCRLKGIEMPFCEKCGAMNPDGTAKCSKCGNPLIKNRKMGNTLILIVGVVMVVVTVVVLVFFG